MMRVKMNDGKQQNLRAKMRRFGAGLLCALLLVFGAMPVLAAPATMIEVSPDGENLFQAMENMLPGESVSSVFTVKNISSVAADFYLTARGALPEDFDGGQQAYEKSLELLSLLDIRVELFENGLGQSGTLLYEGKAHHQDDGGAQRWLLDGRRVLLGEISPGRAVSIRATVSAPSSLDNTFEAAQGKFWWIFSSEGEEPVTPPAPSSAASSSTTSRRPVAPAASSSQVSSARRVPSSTSSSPAVSSMPESVIVDSITPQVVPQAVLDGSWALLNLILTALGLLLALWQLVRYFMGLARRRREDDEGEEDTPQKKRLPLFRWLAVLSGAASVVLFLITQDWRGNMVMVDKWTLWLALIALVQAIFVIAAFRAGRYIAQEEDPEEA